MITIFKPNDHWEPYHDIDKYGKLTLSNIEFTTTHLCNMRCSHCAVGHTLTNREMDSLPIDDILRQLDKVETLRTISFTGGEPLLTKRTIKKNLLPLLQYAKSRGIKTQINSNLTLPMHHIDIVTPYLDVMHISHNWVDEKEFTTTGFSMFDIQPPSYNKGRLYRNIFDNARELSKGGILVSAETMLNRNTLPHLDKIHNEVANEMLCKRHEIHPMYPSSFASSLEIINLDEYRNAINHLLDIRNENVWMLFGTLPFYACSLDKRDLDLLDRINNTSNVTVRNDVDGRSRMNLNIFSGKVSVTDFSEDGSALGNIKDNTLIEIYDKWLNTNLSNSINCHCPKVKCLGANVIVKNMYYKDKVFISDSVK